MTEINGRNGIGWKTYAGVVTIIVASLISIIYWGLNARIAETKADIDSVKKEQKSYNQTIIRIDERLKGWDEKISGRLDRIEKRID